MQLEQKGLMIKQKRKKKPGRWLDPKRTADWMKTLSGQLESGELGYKVSLQTNTIYDLSEDFESEADFVHAITRGAIKRRGSRFESFLPGIGWRHVRGLGKIKFAQLCEVLEHKGYVIWPHLAKAKEGPPREVNEEEAVKDPKLQASEWNSAFAETKQTGLVSYVRLAKAELALKDAKQRIAELEGALRALLHARGVSWPNPIPQSEWTSAKKALEDG